MVRIFNLLILCIFFNCGNPLFGQNAIKYFTRIDRTDSVAGVVKIKYYDGKIFGQGSTTRQYKNSYTNLLKFELETGNELRTVHIDSVFPKSEIVQSDHVIYSGSNYYTVGYLIDYGNHFTNAFYKFDTSGATIKIKELTFNNPGVFTSIWQSPDNNFYAIGYINTDTNSNYLITTGLICKLDTGGNLIWRYLYQGASYANMPEGLISSLDSGVLVSIDAGPYPNLNHAHLIKLDKDGSLQWDSLLPFSMGNNYVKLIDYIPATNDYVFLASTYSDSMLIVKVNSNMQRLWNVAYLAYDSVGSPICGLSQVVKDRSGYIGIGGYVRNLPIYGGSSWILKIDDNGIKQWEGFYDTTITKSAALAPGGNMISFVCIDTMFDGGYIISGGIQDSSNDQTGFVMRIDSNGCLSDTCEAHTFTGITTLPYTADLRVYPNPASSQLYFEAIPYTPSLMLRITDLLGREVYALPLQQDKTTIDCQRWARGMYIWSAWHKGVMMKSGKVVVE